VSTRELKATTEDAPAHEPPDTSPERCLGAKAMDTPRSYNGHMTVLLDLAEEVGVHELTLRRALSEGLLHGTRRTARSIDLDPGELRLAVLIGSAARGALQERSDVDVLVHLEDATWRDQDRLRDRLTHAVGRPVDLVSLEAAAADPLLLDAALRDGRVLADRDGRWPALVARKRDAARRATRAAGDLRRELHDLVTALSIEP
jgi:predicted nucleotidyltransferase